MKKLLYLSALLCVLLFSCEEILMEDDISGETVHLVAPYDGAVFHSTGITFTWDPIENGTQYRIQIARPDFDNPLEIVSDNIVDTTSFTTQLNIGSYQWRVQGVNSGYATAFSSRSFSIESNEDFQNNTITLTAPENNLLTNTSAQNLVWQPVIGATSYELRIVNTSDSAVVLEQQTSATSYSYSFAEGDFQWMVRATNGEQYTLYAVRNISIDTTPPNTPVLNAPADQSSSSDNEVVFEWTRAPLAGSTEKDSIYIFNNSALTDLEYKNEEASLYSTTLDEGTYYWYVKAFDAAGNTGAQSEVFNFTLN